MALRSSIDKHRMTATSTDPLYDHIEQAEKDKVVAESNKT
jgi:hypothetical protein